MMKSHCLDGMILLSRIATRERIMNKIIDLLTFVAVVAIAMGIALLIGRLTGAPECRVDQAFFLKSTSAECRQ
jgi:hypothetical protein